MIDATRSIAEWIASVMIAIEPVIAPATSLRQISSRFETIETAAARSLRGDCAAGPTARAGAAATAAIRLRAGLLMRAATPGPRGGPRPIPAGAAPTRARPACARACAPPGRGG